VSLSDIALKTNTVVLFYGEGAEDAALENASKYGRILAVLGSEKGVRKDDSREMFNIHYNPPASDAMGAVVIGPMDKSTTEAADALLKIVEEPSEYTKPFLWAKDLGQVPKTIRSRCHTVWAYGTPDEEPSEIDPEVLKQALDGDGIAIAEVLTKHTPKEVMTDALHLLTSQKISTRRWNLFKAALGNETISSVASVLSAGRTDD
tara:strand:- start:1534 stop:2148 length:615 start_codon:yes stop_codon:yes gene_type:complete